MKNPKKNILIIAGSDSIGGAGIQADIKTCEAYGCYSATAITALTAQNTSDVSAVMPVTSEFLNAQLEAVCTELKFDAVKIGMLFNEPIMDVVQSFLEKNSAPVVLDPVCVSKMGHKLIKDSAIERLKELMKFAMGNSVAIQDNNGNYKLDKRRSDEKIDNVAALMDAWVAMTRNREMFM